MAAGGRRLRTGIAIPLLLGICLTAAGAMFGSPSLYVPGLVMLLLPPLATAWVAAAAVGSRIERRPPAEPLVEGRPYPLEIELRHGLLPPPAGEVRDPLLEASMPLRGNRHRRRIEVEVSFARRGRHSLGAAEVEVGDPFGIASRALRSDDGGEAIVLPRIEPLSFGAGASGGRALGLGERGFTGTGPDSWAAEFEIDGLRAYRDGSPAARIHWPTVARTGELYERRITSGADAARLVVLDPQRPAGERQLDAAVRAAASICHELAEGPGCTLLIGGERVPHEVEPRLRNFAHAHRLLAVVEAGAGEPALHRIGRAGLIVWVTADPSRAPEARLRRVPAARRLLVRPAAGASGAAAEFEVAGCEARVLGERRERGVAA